MSAPVTAAYAQLFSVGVLWISLHCAGMCGPLVLGLGFGRPERATGRLLQIGAYQAGKATVYAALGALAGLFGRSVSKALADAGPWLAGGLGLLLLAATVVRALSLGGAQAAAPVARLSALLGRAGRLGGGPLRRAFLFGVVLATLPCMLVLWALALAASTASPLHGALVMVLLVSMNSVPLAAAVQLPSLLGRRSSALRSIQPWLGSVSGAWLLLVAAAAAGHLPHASLPLRIAGRGFVVMFW